MGFDNDCILNIQSLAGEYFCPVCHLLVYPNEALQAQCTHLYCKPCLTYVVSTTHACPYDGYRVTETDCKPLLESNTALADTIWKIQVHCLYFRTGCTWQGPLSDCTSHCSACPFGESPVLCNRCGIQIVHRQVQEHAQSCQGSQSQVQQSGVPQDSTSSGAGAATDQSQTAALTGASASQAQTSQASVSHVSGQDANQQANSSIQTQTAQAAMPTPEQWYQQQQQYQQYYQQYPGYDPYQQHYQYYYQYQQGAQQYQQQPMQAYPPQAHGQAQPQVHGQTQTQSQLQAQQHVQPLAQPQPHHQPQVSSQVAPPPPQLQAQPAANVQPQVQSVMPAQPQMQAQGQAPPMHSLPYNQSQSLPQAQPYAQPQPVPQQQMQVPQYQQTQPQMQHPHAQPYSQPQTQTQHYPYPQSQVQLLPHSQPNAQAPVHPPSQQNQPMNPSAQLQTQNAVSGYQSYPQPQPQGQGGTAHPMHITGAQPQPQYPMQMQGQFPSQSPQMRPPQPYSSVPNHQQPAMLSAQGQPPSRPPAQQLPVYPHAQQPGYPFQQHPGGQAAQQAAPPQYGQQQSFPGQGSFMQQQPSMTAQLHAQAPSQVVQQNLAPAYGAQPNVAQNYAGRPVAPQGVGSQSYAQAAAGMGQVRPPQLNQRHPTRTSNQLSATSEQQAVHPQKPLRAAGGEKPRDQLLEKGVDDQDDPNKEGRVMAEASGLGTQVDVMKIKSENGVNGNDSKSGIPGSKQLPAVESKLVENGVQEGKPRIKGDALEGVSEPSPGSTAAKISAEDHKDVHKKAEVQGMKHTAKSTAGVPAPASMLPQSHLVPQFHGTNSVPSFDQGRNQLQPMHNGPSAQHLPGAPLMPQSMPPHVNPQQPALVGRPPGQLRPQGPGQVPPGPPSNVADNSHMSHLKHPLENPSRGIVGPGLSGPLAKPGNIGSFEGNLPPYQPGQTQNPQGEPFVGPSFFAQRPGAFDSHVGMGGREPPRHLDVEQRPPYPMEIGKFPAQRPHYLDGRQPDSLPHGPVERVPYGPAPPGVQQGAMKFGPSAPGSLSAPGMHDERVKHKQFPEKPFPQREFEDDLRKFPRPSHLEAGPSSKYGTQFPSSGPLDHVPHMFGGDGTLRSFDKGTHGFDRDSGLKLDSATGSGPSRCLPLSHPNDFGDRARAAGFPDGNMGRVDIGRHPDFSGPALGPEFGQPHMDGLPPRSPGTGYPGFPRTFGAYGDVGGRPFEGSGSYNSTAEPFGKSISESRFPIPPNQLQRGELDVPGNLRVGEHFVAGPHNQDMLPSHLRRGEHMGSGNLRVGEASGFGPSRGLPRMGEPPLVGNFPQHLPFGESFEGEKPGHPLVGESGFRSSYGFQRFARDGGFYPGEMESLDISRKWNPGSIMCRICKVECGTVEGLDLHSQSREHQRRARDMVLSIKQQNKRQKISKDQASVEERRDGGRPKNSSFQGRRNKR